MRRVRTLVKRSCLHEETLQLLGGSGSESKMFKTLRDSMAFAAVLGYKERYALPLDTNAGVEDIAGAQFDTNEAVDILFAIALAHSKNSDILKEENEAECVKIFEEYANGGLARIQSWITTYGSSDVETAVWRGLSSIGVKPPGKEDETPIVDPEF